MQLKDHLVHKVVDVAALRPADEHQPVMGEALQGGLLPDVGAGAQLQLDLHTLDGNHSLVSVTGKL